MNDSGSVALLHADDPGPESVAAREWCLDRGVAVESIATSAVAAGGADGPLGGHDVVWWHAGTVPETGVAREVAEPVRAHVEDGGALVLSLAALAAVADLGIDPVAPDAVGPEPDAPATGPLLKALYDDLAPFAEVEGRRPLTRGGTRATLARYDAILPQRGEVLASTRREDHDVPGLVTVCSWTLGEGAVLGLGDGLLFDADLAPPLARQRDALADGVLRGLPGAALPSRPHDASDLTAMRDRLADDHHRPQYHLTPPANWLNDPNGLIHWNGAYHVFYQYNPGGPHHDTIHWGHAVSEDLLTWRDEPVALTPSPDGPDREGCWSGCAVVDDGTPTILYTGGRNRQQLPCLATAGDESLRTWRKDPGNPVIEELPDDPDVLSTTHWDGEFRDHCVWREDGRWHQLIGAGVESGGGAVLHYDSADLRDWRYRGPILTGDRDVAGTVWECPELLDLGERSLLHVSNYEDVVHFLGTYEDGRFDPDSRGVLDHGDFYAPQSLRDPEGRLLTWGWLPEARDVSAHWDAGWAGAMSVPRELSLAADGGLRQRPAAELTALRGERERVDRTLTAGETRTLETAGRSLELAGRIRLVDAEAVELSVLATPDGTKRTPVRYTREGEVVIDRAESSTDPRATRDSQRMAVPPHDDPLDLRVFVDGSVIEVFANERHCLTSRVYPTDEGATGVTLAAVGGRADVALECWPLAGTR